MNGETLSPEAQAALLSNIGGTDFTAMWEEARSSRALGTGLTIGGGVAALGGLIATCAGLAAMGVGITKIVKSGKKLDGIVSSYNNGNSVTQVTLGPTSNGFGISLMF